MARSTDKPSRTDAARAGPPFARLAEPDRMIHEPMRLKLMSALAVTPSLTFPELRTLLDATDGNLSVHARKLEDAGYLACRKEFAGRVPKTVYSLTPAGRRALEAYIDQMEALIRSMRPNP